MKPSKTSAIASFEMTDDPHDPSVLRVVFLLETGRRVAAVLSREQIENLVLALGAWLDARSGTRAPQAGRDQTGH
jgi:hypothetical protein